MTGSRLAAVILAGGRGSRMGGPLPKPLAILGDRPLIRHVLDRIPPFVAPVLVNANDAQAFAPLGLDIVPDRLAGFQGPLAGLEAGCDWLRRHHPEAGHLLCLPADTPFLPLDVAARLLETADGRVRLAAFRGRLHPTVAIWPLTALDGLDRHLRQSASRSLVGFAETVGFEAVSFPPSVTAPGGDPFFNVNTPEDLADAATSLSG